jgi:uncharacterized protein YkwD
MALATRPKPKSHHKKRQAQHHRQSKHYNKAYWPYLPMLFIVGLGLVINTVWANVGSVLGGNTDFSSESLLSATNQQRAGEQQSALTIDPQLSAAAQAKAEDMVARNYWAHDAPDGKTPWQFISAAGYQYQLAGENLAYGFSNAGDTVTGWMNSPTHRANIMNARYMHVGFGVAHAANYHGDGPQTIVVAEYAKPVEAAAHITFTVPETADNAPLKKVQGADKELASRPVSRLAVLTGGDAAWSTLVVGLLAGAAFTLFVTRHGLRLHKALIRGERFVAHHPLLDVTIVIIFTAGFVLTRSSGIIR